MDSVKTLIVRLPIYPLLDDVSLLVLIIPLNYLFNLLQKAPENDRLILDGGLVEQCDAFAVLDLPYFDAVRQVVEDGVELVHLLLLIQESFFESGA